MAKAIQCDVCRRLVPVSQAEGWRALAMRYNSIRMSEIYPEEVGPQAEVCSRECAMQWFEQVMDTCFPLREREVGG